MTSDREKVKWRWDCGVYLAFCPHCDEPIYDEKKCVFCGKEYEYTEPKIKNKVVEAGEYKVVQTTNNHIHILKNGIVIRTISCVVAKTEEELREIAEGLRNGK